jgi:hypothetical protein
MPSRPISISSPSWPSRRSSSVEVLVGAGDGVVRQVLDAEIIPHLDEGALVFTAGLIAEVRRQGISGRQWMCVEKMLERHATAFFFETAEVHGGDPDAVLKLPFHGIGRREESCRRAGSGICERDPGHDLALQDEKRGV